MAELKPCPFCGRIPKIEDCGDHRYFVKCKCGIEQSSLYAQRCDAIRRWNRRKTEPQMEHDKGLQLFADILFDKEKSEQFLKECKAMGIEPETEREDE